MWHRLSLFADYNISASIFKVGVWVEEFAELRRHDTKRVSPRPGEGANEDELDRG
jgi:hypothetical protein